ncbi:hypothetical protein SCALM49S_08406 [Streptomyces californicus]
MSAETGTTAVFRTHSVDEAVFLGSRAIVLTNRPGTVALDLPIGLPAPEPAPTNCAACPRTPPCAPRSAQRCAKRPADPYARPPPEEEHHDHHHRTPRAARPPHPRRRPAGPAHPAPGAGWLDRPPVRALPPGPARPGHRRRDPRRRPDPPLWTRPCAPNWTGRCWSGRCCSSAISTSPRSSSGRSPGSGASWRPTRCSPGGSPEVARLDRAAVPTFENVWHADVTFRECPALGAVLQLRERLRRTVGDTLWADMAAAYDDLPEEVKERVEGARAVHDFIPGFARFSPPERLAAHQELFPPVEHPVVRRQAGHRPPDDLRQRLLHHAHRRLRAGGERPAAAAALPAGPRPGVPGAVLLAGGRRRVLGQPGHPALRRQRLRPAAGSRNASPSRATAPADPGDAAARMEG